MKTKKDYSTIMIGASLCLYLNFSEDFRTLGVDVDKINTINGLPVEEIINLVANKVLFANTSKLCKEKSYIIQTLKNILKDTYLKSKSIFEDVNQPNIVELDCRNNGLITLTKEAVVYHDSYTKVNGLVLNTNTLYRQEKDDIRYVGIKSLANKMIQKITPQTNSNSLSI